MGDSEAEVPNLGASDTGDQVALAVSTVASLVPVLGGAVSNLINGYANHRQQQRVAEVLIGLSQRIRDTQSRVDEEYVRSEDFEDLLGEALQRAARERSEDKRRIYRDFLASDMTAPAGSYDEKLRFLRTLEELQPDHLRVLKALMADDDQAASGSGIGSQIQTLQERLPGIGRDQILELVDQLNRMALTNMQSLMTIMTASGARRLSHAITPYGQRFVRLL